MSFNLIHLVYQTKLKLSPSEHSVLCCLAYHANDNKGLLCCPSIETLVKETRLSPRQVKRVISSLQKIEVIKKENHGRNNYYFISEVILKGNISEKSYPQIGATMAPIHEQTGAIQSPIGATMAPTGAIQSPIGATMAPNILNNIKDIKKDITENFLENKKKTEEQKQHARKCREEAMQALKQSTAGMKRLSF